MADKVGLDSIFPGEDRAVEALAGAFSMLVLAGTVFFGVVLVSGPAFPIATLCLDEGIFNLVGLSLVSEKVVVGKDEADAIEMRDWDGRRSLGIGCDKKSLACPEDDCDGDRE
jgi:hypothetical protein